MSTSALSGVQALVFDTYGTVVDWRTSVLEALRALGRSLNLAIDWEAFLALWEPRPILDRVNTGELPWMTMEQVHRLALQTPLARYGLTELPATRSIVSSDAVAIEPLARFGAGLDPAQAAVRHQPTVQRELHRHGEAGEVAGLPWDCVITAENARRYKPHPNHTAPRCPSWASVPSR